MKLQIFNHTIVIFKIVCVILTTSMIGFWTYKYHKNEDVSVIEYESIDSMDEVTYPEITICINRPFIAKTLLEFGGNVTAKEYSKYLKGIRRYQNDKKFDHIPFTRATINLFNYLKHLK